METKTETKYTPTPGPWHLIHDAGQLRVDSERDGAVAVCYTLMRGEFKAPSECVANARLIAAAPDLLDILLDLRRAWLDGRVAEVEGILTGDVLAVAIERATG